jgi:hypothetical protein
MITNPIKTFLWGLGAVIVLPVVTVLLAATLVGLPLALLLVMVMVAGLIIGPVPAITALGNRILFKRGGLLGAFVVGAILWRLAIWLIPLVGGVLFVIALVWGVGAWIVGMLAARNDDPVPAALLPASMIPESGVPDDWEPPLPPLAADLAEDNGLRTTDHGPEAGAEDDGPEADAEGEAESDVADADDIEVSVEVVPLSEPPPLPEPEEEAPEPVEEDETARRRAEFDALLDAAVKDSEADQRSSDDEWGLPTS